MIQFDHREQNEGEDFDTYLIAIQQLAQDADLAADHCHECKTKCIDRRLAARIISGIMDDSTRTKLLRETEFPSKDRVVSICSSHETAMMNCKDHKKNEIRKAGFDHKEVGKQKWFNNQKDFGHRKDNDVRCRNCGNFHFMGQDCFAKRLVCNYCKQKGHIEKMCTRKKKAIRQMYTLAGDEVQVEVPHPVHSQEEDLKTCTFGRVTVCAVNSDTIVQVNVEETDTGLQLGTFPAIADTGAQVCVAGTSLIQKLSGKNKTLLSPPHKRMYGFDGQPAQCIGTLMVKIKNDFYCATTKVCICPGVKELLLSLKVSKALGYVRHEYPSIIPPIVKTIKTPNTLSKDAVPSKITTPRKLPHAARESIKAQLDEMVAKHIIVSVEDPTDFVHPMVPVLKPDGTWRLCIDLSKINKYVQRPYHPMISPKDAVELPTEAQWFASMDAKSGYWQIALDEESQELTTFITPFGRFKFLRAPMGLSSTQDEFCRRTDEALMDLSQFRKVVDDILVYGKTKQDLLDHVLQVLERCREKSISLNPKKFKFGLQEIQYVGYIVGKDGIRTDNSKIEAIEKFPQPKNLTELRAFMGIVNQFSHFTSKIASAAVPLRDLMKPKNIFIWTQEHTNAFQELKTILCQPPVLAQFDLSLPIMLQTDASRLKGLGYALLQKHDDEWKLVQCGSRFLTDTESRYAMIELELLAIVWAATIKCSTFLLGNRFTLVTDHKPLIPILNSYTLDMIENPRLRTLKEKLGWYSFEAVWKSGAKNYIPDALSRAPINKPKPEDCFHDELNTALGNIVKRIQVDLHPEELQDPVILNLETHAQQDLDYQKLLLAIQDGFKDIGKAPPTIKQFSKMRNDLCISGGLILKGTQIVIPATMRKRILADLHSGHQGIERTKRRARQTVYWPGINADIKNMIDTCEPCQLYQPSQPKETIISDPVPSRPFVDTSADLFSYGSAQYLVYVDKFSGWPIVDSFRSDPTTHQVIDKLVQSFAVYGIPIRVRTDGGPQFKSREFAAFVEDWGIQHTFSSPHYPQSNGHAEAAVKAMKKLVIKSGCKTNLCNQDFVKGLME